MNQRQTPRVCIVGAGRIGCVVGACLMDAGFDVELLGREKGKSLLQLHGLSVNTWKGETIHIPAVKINYKTRVDELSRADLVLLCVKNGDSCSALQELAPLLSDSTVFLSLQNGINQQDAIRSYCPQHELIKGFVSFNVIHNKPGEFQCATEGRVYMEKHACSDALCQALKHRAIEFVSTPNIEALQWTKLIMNLNNAVNALSGLPLVQQLEERNYRRIMARIIEEALKVARASSVKPQRLGRIVPSLLPPILRSPNFVFTRLAKSMLTIAPGARSSMFDDLQARRTTEIDWLNGEIVRRAHKLGVSVPANERIVYLIKRAERAALGSPRLSPASLL